MGPAVGLQHYLLVSAMVFGAGMAVVICRRNAVAVLMGVELILNAAALNFIAFGRFVGSTRTLHPELTGQAVAIFVIVLAAAEAAVALAIVLNLYNHFETVDVDQPTMLRE
ncbi:MAG: NADH-quinone oxidoreductase subunit NuoK [Planctomycetes bacterium]|nr:NADH-quinone oxidoreductase subunit NuoK [Planctomycetota bacterium]